MSRGGGGGSERGTGGPDSCPSYLSHPTPPFLPHTLSAQPDRSQRADPHALSTHALSAHAAGSCAPSPPSARLLLHGDAARARWQAACFFGADLEGLTVERARIPRASELLPLPSAAGGRLAKLSAAHGVEAVLAGASLYWQFVGGGRTLETGQKAFAPFLAVEAWLRGMGSAEAAAAA